MRRRKPPAIEKPPLLDRPGAAPSPKAAALPVPVVVPPRQEAATADEKATASAARPIAAKAAFHSATAAAGRNACLMRSLSLPRKKPLLARENIWFRAAAVAVALGVGWIAGANTFDHTERVRHFALRLHTIEAKLDHVAKAARRGPSTDFAAVKSDLAALHKSVDGLAKGLARQRAELGTAKAGLDAVRSAFKSTKTQIASLMPTGAITSDLARSLSKAGRAPHASFSREARATAERRRIPPNGYVLRTVHHGVAVIESHTGLHKVVPGEVLAGAGRVESIVRHGRRWVVVTSAGLIDSDPY